MSKFEPVEFLIFLLLVVSLCFGWLYFNDREKLTVDNRIYTIYCKHIDRGGAVKYVSKGLPKTNGSVIEFFETSSGKTMTLINVPCQFYKNTSKRIVDETISRVPTEHTK